MLGGSHEIMRTRQFPQFPRQNARRSAEMELRAVFWKIPDIFIDSTTEIGGGAITRRLHGHLMDLRNCWTEACSTINDGRLCAGRFTYGSRHAGLSLLASCPAMLLTSAAESGPGRPTTLATSFGRATRTPPISKAVEKNPPVDIDQSQDCPHLRMEPLGQDNFDDVHLLGHAGYQFCAVAPSDPELWWRRPKDAAGPSELCPARLPVLGIYDIDARRPYRDVVDICRGPRNPPVVEGDDTSVGEGVEPAGNGPFSFSPAAPRPSVLGVTEDSQERPTYHRVLFTDAAFPGRASTVVFPLGRPAGHSPLQCTGLDGRLLDARPTSADGARPRARSTFVCTREMCLAIYDSVLCVPVGTRAPFERGPTGSTVAREAQVHDPAVTHVGKGTHEARLEDLPGTQRGCLNSQGGSRTA